MTTPTIGRIVHYYQDDDREDPEAAIISRVCEDARHVDLVVLGVNRLAHVLAVPYLERVPEAETIGPACFWTWPPRADLARNAAAFDSAMGGAK